MLRFFLFFLAIIACTSCISSTTISHQEKASLLRHLEAKIDDSLGGNFGHLILKLDLLRLDPQSTTVNSQQCPISPLYASLYAKDIERDAFKARIRQIEGRLNTLLAQRKKLLHTLARSTAYKTEHLEYTIRATKVHFQELEANATETIHPVLTNIFFYRDDTIRQGGPFIPVSAQNTTASFDDLSNDLSYLTHVSNVMDAFPVITPLPESYVSGQFRIRRDPINGRIARHEGIDLVGPDQSRVLSAASGIVTFSGRAGNYGNLIIVDHGLGITTRYGHLSALFVRKGEKIGIGQVIGIQGKTGRTTGAHLHYEVRLNDKPYNPATFLKLASECSL